jgi:hypothetical protein
MVEEAASAGFTQYLLIDYTWPFDGRYGYGVAAVQALRDDLNGVDAGM